MRTLYNNKQINTTIDTNHRIFKVETYENEVVLVNLNDAYLLLDEIKTLWHLWNFEFEKFSKKDLIKMYNSQKS